MRTPTFPTIMQALTFWAESEPDRKALIFLDASGQQETSATYAVLLPDVRRAAWAWRQLGVKPGDVVLLALEHSYELVTGFLGAIVAGAVPVILPYPRPKALGAYVEQLGVLVGHTEAAAVFATAAVTERTQERMAGLNSRVHAFKVAEAESPPNGFSVHERGDDEALHLQLTSGTTGAPNRFGKPYPL